MIRTPLDNAFSPNALCRNGENDLKVNGHNNKLNHQFTFPNRPDVVDGVNR